MKSTATHGHCGTVTVALDGIVDEHAVARTLARIVELRCEAAIVDISRARSSDVTLALLARGLASLSRTHAMLRGLVRHHALLLRALGLGALVEDPPQPDSER